MSTSAGRVLVIDDRPESITLLRALLEKLSVEVSSAMTGEEGIKAVKEQSELGLPFHLILVDIRMPNLNGNEVIKQIRATGFSGGVVALTASASIAGKKESQEVGADGYFGKGVVKKELLAALVEKYCKSSN